MRVEPDIKTILDGMLNVSGSVARAGAVQAARAVRILVLDVDGVCTDGRIFFNDRGEITKAFHCADGLGIKTALKAGLDIGVITGRDDPCVRARMTSLGVTRYYPGHESKLGALAAIGHSTGLEFSQMAYLGDDWIDLDPMRAVGLPMAVANAVAQVRAEALYLTAARGGHGAVREAIEFLLASREDGFNPADLWTHPEAP